MTRNRLEAFSDGVFAIASTLLVIELRPPELEAAETCTHHARPTSMLRSRLRRPYDARVPATGAPLLERERELEEFERLCALEGDANGAPHPDPASYAEKFTAKYTHRRIAGGVRHNLAQEAPQAFAEAVVEVDGY